MTLGIIFCILMLSVFILMETFTAMNNKSSVLDSFFQHEFWGYCNTMCILVILAAIIIYSSLYLIKNRIKTNIFKFSAEEIKNIFAIYGMFYTFKIEIAGRKGSRIFRLFLIIFVYLAILNLIGLLFVAVTAKSQLSTNFWFSLTIIISFILLGIRNKGLKFYLMFWNTCVGLALRIKKNLLEKASLFKQYALGVLETLIAVLQSFIPATLEQIWVNEIFKVLSGFFRSIAFFVGYFFALRKNILLSTIIITDNLIDEIFTHDMFAIACYFLIIYLLIKIVDIKGKDIKTNFNSWVSLLQIALISMIYFMLITYMIWGLICIIFPNTIENLLLRTIHLGSMITLLFVSINLCFILNTFKYKFSEKNKFFLLIYYLCKNIIKILYKTKVLDKIFKLIWFQFFNKNQRRADFVNVFSMILGLLYFCLMRTVIQVFRAVVLLNEHPFSINFLFILCILFSMGFIGFSYRLLVNLSTRIVSFTFLVFPTYYNNIIIRNESENKPKIHFYYNRLTADRWFLCGLLVIRLGLLLFTLLLLVGYYKNKNLDIKLEEIRTAWKQELNSKDYYEKMLKLLEIEMHNFSGSSEEFYELQKLKAFCNAILKPEDIENILQDYPEILKPFRLLYPKKATIIEVSPNDGLNTNIFLISFFIIIILVIAFIVYYLYKKKIKKMESENEIIKKNDLLGITNILLFLSIILLILLSSLQKILQKKGLDPVTKIKNMLKNYYKQSITAILIMIGLLISAYLIFLLFFFFIPISKYKILLAIIHIISYFVCILGILNLGLMILEWHALWTGVSEISNKFLIQICIFYEKFAVLLIKTGYINKIVQIFWFQFCNKNTYYSDITAILSASSLQVILGMTLQFLFFFDIEDYSDLKLLCILALVSVSSLGLLYRLFSNFSFKFWLLLTGNFPPEIIKAIQKENESYFHKVVGVDSEDSATFDFAVWNSTGIFFNLYLCTMVSFYYFCLILKTKAQLHARQWELAKQYPDLAEDIFRYRPKEYEKWKDFYTQPHASKNNQNLFDYFFQQEFWSYFNSINFTVILVGIVILVILYLRKK